MKNPSDVVVVRTSVVGRFQASVLDLDESDAAVLLLLLSRPSSLPDCRRYALSPVLVCQFQSERKILLKTRQI